MPNLYSALHQLRRRWTARFLWADAICINQQDPEERTEQVRMMGEIYSKVWRVLIWLGEDDELSSKSFQSVKELHSILSSWIAIAQSRGDRLALSKLVRESFIKPNNFDFSGQLARRKYDWQPLMELFSRPWFQRKWVIQEYVMAKRVIRICGRNIIE
jgi:Heterokaryon incompatibility protein (HET)